MEDPLVTASWIDVITSSAEVLIGFALGLGVGFVVSNRWKIVKRNGNGRN